LGRMESWERVGGSTRLSCGNVRCGWSLESQREYDSEWAAINSIAAKLGIGDGGDAAEVGPSGRDRYRGRGRDHVRGGLEIRRLRREVAELRRANDPQGGGGLCVTNARDGGDVEDLRARYRHLTSREHNKVRPNQAQSVIAAAILRHLHAVITTRQTWDPAIGTHGRRPTLEPAAAA